jgi:hypothetical protein
MDAKQFAWTYMVAMGTANATPSYYGGWDPVDKKIKTSRGHHGITSYHDAFLKMIREIGVDWDKTDVPMTDTHAQFEGTFADSSTKEYLDGCLVLKNGYEQHWIAEPYISNVFEIMADIDNFKQKFYDYFGE